jgi:hypothetical protein
MTHRFREQARCHKDLQCPKNRGQPQIKCGSGLAREGGGTFNMDAE